MAGRAYRYARVSTREQNLDRRLDALAAFGVDGVFADKASGKDFERPEWLRLTAALRAGDVLVVKSIDRLGRSYEEIIEQWRAITKEVRAGVVVLDMPLLDTHEYRGGVTGALISDIVLQLLSYVAQVERESIHRCQAEGIAAARARGVRFGGPRKRRPGLYKSTGESYLAGHIAKSMTGCCIKVFVSSIEKVAMRRPGGECGSA
ncbi:recombinase family protein [Collinsella tanakaei]|nr:recombinase family protein [Collinsella tanakaei]